MSRDLLFRQRITVDLNVIRALIKINIEHHCRYMSVYHPMYNKLIGRWLSAHLWRISPRIRQIPAAGKDIVTESPTTA